MGKDRKELRGLYVLIVGSMTKEMESGRRW